MNKTYCTNCDELFKDSELVPHWGNGDTEHCPECDEFDELMTEAEYQQLERDEFEELMTEAEYQQLEREEQ